MESSQWKKLDLQGAYENMLNGYASRGEQEQQTKNRDLEM
jgi:hypothetical protein